MKILYYWIIFKNNEVFTKDLSKHVFKISHNMEEVNDLVKTGNYFSVAKSYIIEG